MSPSPPPIPSCCLLPPASDYIIKEKTVLLQKKDSEGFGFVLRGAKGECWPGRGWEILSDPRGRAWIGRMEKEKGPPYTHTLKPTHCPTLGCWSLSSSESTVTWSEPHPLLGLSTPSPPTPPAPPRLQRRPPSRNSPPPRPSRRCSTSSLWTRVAWHGGLDCEWETSSSR